MSVAPSIEIDSCDFLFLRKITELDYQGLRLLIEEGRVSLESTTMNIGGTEITNGHPVKPTGCHFEITWQTYIAYGVRNELYYGGDKDDEIAAGEKFRIYAKSRYLDYIDRATFATSEYPGPFQHYCVVCEDHVVDIVSIDAPQVRRLSTSMHESDENSFQVN